MVRGVRFEPFDFARREALAQQDIIDLYRGRIGGVRGLLDRSHVSKTALPKKIADFGTVRGSVQVAAQKDSLSDFPTGLPDMMRCALRLFGPLPGI